MQCSGTFRPGQPQDNTAEHPAVLLCPPFGQEAVRAQRLYRALSDRLAARGQASMRFDYVGTGDADGSEHDATLALWTRNIVQADQALREFSQARQVIWLGLRLGGTLAALASMQASSSPDRIVLWEPVTSGPQHLSELEASTDRNLDISYGQRWSRIQPMLTGRFGAPPRQAAGFLLTDKLIEDFQQLTLPPPTDWHTTDLRILCQQPALLANWQLSAGRPTQIDQIDDLIDWGSDEAMNTAIVPARLSSQLMAACGAIHQASGVRHAHA
jgi:pimeloyl-ACP methyl ester carboxylesterase